MDLLSMLTACAMSINPVVVPTLYQIAHTHGGNALTIEAVETGQVYKPSSHEEAIGITTALYEAGVKLHVGIVQVNVSTALNEYDTTIPELFDTCKNVAIGSDQLALAISQTKTVRQALTIYLGSGPWAREVMQQPSAPEFGSDSNSIGKIYAAPGNRIFATKQTNSHRAPRESPHKKIWAAQETDGGSKTDEGSETTEPEWSKPEARPQKRKTPKKTGQAQAPVTDERLLTTRELEESGNAN